MRYGIGYDIHRLAPDRRLVLGGVEIAFGMGLLGHSDADALVHAIIDALLGAAAIGDIGQLFPDTDPEYEDAESLKLLGVVAEILSKDGFHVANVDSIIVAEKPKMAPYIMDMRKKISAKLEIPIGCVSVKAKTNEGVDAIGCGEAIAAWAIACIEREQE